MYLDDRVVRLQLWDTAGQVQILLFGFRPIIVIIVPATEDFHA
jgi:hypothetical protein